MKSKSIGATCLGLACALLLLSSCALTPPPEEPAVEEPAAEATQPVTEELPQPEGIVLRVSVVQYEGMLPTAMELPAELQPAQRLSLLIEGMERAAAKISTPDRPVQFEIAEIRDMVAPGEPTCQAGMFSNTLGTSPTCLTALNIDGCFGAYPTNLPDFDVYMLESVWALYAIEGNLLGSIDPGRLAFPLEQLAEPSRLTFEGWGIGQATSPLVLIYNPEILGELPETMSAGEVLDIAWSHPLVLPPHKGIIGAMAQSLLGDEFDETSPLRRSFYEKITVMVGERINELVSTGQISSLHTVDLLNAFAKQEVAWTIHDTMFLRALAAQGYAGPVATARLPVIEKAGGTAMMVGWGVPAQSRHGDAAWEFIGQLVNDPAVIQWALSNGELPVSEAGMQILLANPQMAESWLPRGLLARDNGLAILLKSAAESRAWRLQPSVPVEVYNRQIVPASSDILRRLFRGEIDYNTGMEEWLKLLEANGLIRD